jgi:hypothetical protein
MADHEAEERASVQIRAPRPISEADSTPESESARPSVGPDGRVCTYEKKGRTYYRIRITIEGKTREIYSDLGGKFRSREHAEVVLAEVRRLLDAGEPAVWEFFSRRSTLGDPATRNACIIWDGTKDPDGYGIDRVGREQRAHRAEWVRRFGMIPAGLCVIHLCDTPACVQIHHLALATQAANMFDRQRKGRYGKPAHS